MENGLRGNENCMTEIQGKSILVRVSARFELVRVRVISGVNCVNKARFKSCLCKGLKSVKLTHLVFVLCVLMSALI